MMYEPVLVLNANFEPINVCNTKRAIGLILAGKAMLIQNGRGEIRTVKTIYPRPSIIRLERMIRRPRPQVKLTKREILRRDEYTCQYCGNRSNNLTIDHIIPRHMGGEYSWENLITACSTCNHRKGGRTLEQAQMRMMAHPAEPPGSAKYIFARHLRENQDWEPFVDGW
jgi:5-methylcytosine-specific restriction endonuclease McrA